MFKNLLEYCDGKKLNCYEMIPLTFLLEIESNNYANELENFIKYFSFTEKTLESY